MRDRNSAAFVFIALLLIPVIAHIVLATVPGVASLVVIGGSMEPTINRGSIVYVQETNEYGPGDVISFSDGGQIVTHRIVTETEEGYITGGDANQAVDEEPVSESQIIGEVILGVPSYGYFILYLSNPIGFLIGVMLPGMILIILEMRHLVRRW